MEQPYEPFPGPDFGPPPALDLTDWTLDVFGEVDRPTTWTWAQFVALPTVEVTRESRDATNWSKHEVTWTGVPVTALAALAGVQARARCVIVHSADPGYTTNLPLAAMLHDDVLLAWQLDGELLAPELGGPVRTLLPPLYAWKTAKFVRRIEFSAAERAAFECAEQR